MLIWELVKFTFQHRLFHGSFQDPGRDTENIYKWSHALSNLQKKNILTVIYIFPLQIPVCHILCVRKYQSSHGSIGGSSREKMS